MAISFEELVWVVPAAVTLAGVWRPRYALVALAAALPLFGAPPGGPYLGALDVAALAAILTSLRAIRKRYPGEPDWRHSGLEWPVAAWIMVGIVSMVPLVYHPPDWSPSTLAGLLRALPGVESSLPLYTWRALANLLLGFGLYFAVRRSFAGRPLRPLAVGFAAGIALVVLGGLAEVTDLISLASYRAIGDPLYDRRLHSLFFHSAWLAEYLVIATPFVAASLLTARGWWRGGTLVLLGLCLLTIVLTQQRAAWLVVVAQGAAAPFVLARRRERGTARWVALGVIVVLLVGAAVVWYLEPDLVAPLSSRLGELTSDLSGRPALWGAAAELTRQRPFLGWGLGSFATAYDTLHPPGTPQAWRFRGTAHSLYFHLLAERGVLGLLALVALGWAAASGLREVAARSSHGDSPVAAGLLIGLVGTAVYGLAQYVFYLKNIEFLVWMLLGVASLVMAGCPPSPGRRLAQAIVVAALVLLPVRYGMTEPMTPRNDRAYGFHEPEKKPGRTLVWIEGHAARRIEWKGEVLRLDIVDGHPKASLRDVDVRITVDGVERWSGRAPNEWRTIALDLGSPTAKEVTLGFTVEPTFRPFSDYLADPELDSSRDIRELGIAVSNISWSER